MRVKGELNGEVRWRQKWREEVTGGAGRIKTRQNSATKAAAGCTSIKKI